MMEQNNNPSIVIGSPNDVAYGDGDVTRKNLGKLVISKDEDNGHIPFVDELDDTEDGDATWRTGQNHSQERLNSTTNTFAGDFYSLRSPGGDYGGILVERREEILESPKPDNLVIVGKRILRHSDDSIGVSPTVESISPVFSPSVTSQSENLLSTPKLIPIPAEGHFVVVAIDFGTTMSGYAFSFVRDPGSIHMMRKWEGGDPGVINQKTPTTLLLTPDGTFHSFGFTARDFYHDLDHKEAKRWLYFEKFKMSLHYNSAKGTCFIQIGQGYIFEIKSHRVGVSNASSKRMGGVLTYLPKYNSDNSELSLKKLNKDTTITAASGKQYPAAKVFSHALRYFKDHALQELSDQSATEIINEDIRWVLTVPAIWKAPAKQFMRHAAYEAGIGSIHRPEQLLIALEPEAASIYVRKLRLHQLVSESSSPVYSLSPRPDDPNSPCSPKSNNDDSLQDLSLVDGTISISKSRTLPRNLKLFESLPRQSRVSVDVDKEGMRYMVVDCGGGTVDITVHEMESKHGHLHELYKATGGPYGSVGVDLAFENLLVTIFGSEFIQAFKHKRPAGWVDLMIAFESRKRAANPDKHNPLNVSLPFSFIDYYKKYKGQTIEAAISKYGDNWVRWSSQGMLRLSPEAMKRLFHSTLEHIKQAIGDVLNSVQDIKFLFLVGGFAESLLVQHEIRNTFGHLLRILIPQDVSLTILKGAVYFGLDPTIISVRRSRMTYGVEVVNKYIPDKHPKSKLVRKDGVDWCTGIFDAFVVADQPVALGDTVVRSYAPAKFNQKMSIFNIYATEKKECKFVADPGVTLCGTLTLDLTDVVQQQTSTYREIQTSMTFGDTEIKVSALDVVTGKCVKAAIDFLNK